MTNIELTERQQEIVVGSLLGDGCIKKDRNGVCCLSKCQSITTKLGADKYEYLQWHYDELSPYSSSVKTYRRKRGDSSYEFFSKCGQTYKELESKWYKPTKPKRTKIVPQDIKLTPLVLCVWFVDDGINYPARRQAQICTQSFTEKENEFLSEILNRDLGVVSKVQEFRGLFNLYVGPESYLKLINTITPHCTWSCFGYKCSLEGYKPQTYARGELNGHSKLTEKDAIRIIQEYNQGDITQTELARRHGIKQSAVSRLVNGKRWSHIRSSSAQN